jgi:hypothetical protein
LPKNIERRAIKMPSNKEKKETNGANEEKKGKTQPFSVISEPYYDDETGELKFKETVVKE